MAASARSFDLLTSVGDAVKPGTHYPCSRVVSTDAGLTTKCKNLILFENHFRSFLLQSAINFLNLLLRFLRFQLFSPMAFPHSVFHFSRFKTYCTCFTYFSYTIDFSPSTGAIFRIMCLSIFIAIHAWQAIAFYANSYFISSFRTKSLSSLK